MLPNPADPADPPPSGAGRAGRPRPFASRRAGFAPSPGLLLLRIAIMALGLTIGIVLLSRGDLVLGGLLVVFAGLRLSMFLTLRHRRAQWRDAHARVGPR